MALLKTVFVPMGYALELTTDAVSSGTYTRLGNPGGTRYTPVAIAASADVTVGPFNEPRNYVLSVVAGDINYSLSFSGMFTKVDEDAEGADFALKQDVLSGLTVTAATVAVGDLVLIQDISNANNLKVVTAQSIADLVVDSVEAAVLQGNIDNAQGDATQALSDAADAQGDATQALSDAADAQSDATDALNLLAIGHTGTAATGVTAVEYGDSFQHTTVLTVASVLPAITGGADQATGKLLYTFPAGAVVVKQAYMSMGITQTESNIDADTPDVGIGTTIGSGTNALLSDVGADSENVLTGQTANNCTGTAEVKTVADQVLVIEAGGDHTVYFNAADGWAADGDAAAIIAGTVVLHWQFMA